MKYIWTFLITLILTGLTKESLLASTMGKPLAPPIPIKTLFAIAGKNIMIKKIILPWSDTAVKLFKKLLPTLDNSSLGKVAKGMGERA